MSIRRPVVSIVCATMGLIVAGCHQSGSPGTVQADIAKATAEAAQSNAKAQQRETKTADSADESLARAQASADQKKTDAAADTLITEAEGANKVALAKCEAFSADHQRDCRDAANAALELAKARAQEAKAQN